MKIVKAPGDYHGSSHPWVSLAGPIEMGVAENWQKKCERLLADSSGTILNPVREDWDSTWEESIDNPKFLEQVEWELNAFDDSDVMLVCFNKTSHSPITLLELGLRARGKDPRVVVCCPDGFWHKGNVDIVCRLYGIEQVAPLDELVASAASNTMRG